MSLPRNKANPVGQVRRINRVRSRIRGHLREVQIWLVLQILEAPVNVTNNVARYEYLVDRFWLERLVTELKARLGNAEADFFSRETEAAYREGVGLAASNLAAISDDYTRDLTTALSREPVLRRMALAGARVFEEMDGFTAELARELARIIMEGVDSFRGPRVIARDLRNRFGISRRRADRIARTEITGALRRGRLDEAEDAGEQFGINVAMFWVSALLDTTRPSHAALHGNQMTPQEIREFYARDGNAINCRCAQVEAVLGRDGKPIQKRLQRRLRDQRQDFQRA